jgi:ABC-type transport system substrate-binding protein
MNRAFALCLFCAGMLSCLVGCAEPPDGPRWAGAGRSEPHRGGTFTFFHTANVRGIDPHVSFDELSTMAIRLVHEGLLDYDSEARIVPGVAEALPELLADGRTYRFRLRRGVFFQDSPVFPGGKGRELTAEDVRWSLEHMIDPHTHSGGAFFFMSIDGATDLQEGRASTLRGVRAIDRYTVDITLEKPDQTFLSAMAMTFAYPVPRENYAAHPNDIALHPVGVGPFVLDSWERGVRLVFKRNHRYWREGLPYVDRMVFLENLTQDVAAMRFRNGDLDHMHHARQPDFIYFREAKEWAPYRTEEPAVNIWGIALNTQMKPFNNVHARRAVAFGINRERWRKVLNHKILPMGQMVPMQLMGYDPKLPNLQRYDAARAKEELALAGFPNGITEPVTLWFSDGASAVLQAELFQEDMRQIGIAVQLKPASFAEYLQQTGKPGQAQASIAGWNQDFPDPADFLDVLLHSKSIHPENSENRAFYVNPEFDALLDTARVESDPATRAELYRQANDIAARDAPWAVLYSRVDQELSQPYLKNYTMNPVFSQDYRFVWLDEPRRRIR